MSAMYNNGRSWRAEMIGGMISIIAGFCLSVHSYRLQMAARHT